MLFLKIPFRLVMYIFRRNNKTTFDQGIFADTICILSAEPVCSNNVYEQHIPFVRLKTKLCVSVKQKLSRYVGRSPAVCHRQVN